MNQKIWIKAFQSLRIFILRKLMSKIQKIKHYCWYQVKNVRLIIQQIIDSILLFLLLRKKVCFQYENEILVKYLKIKKITSIFEFQEGGVKEK